jgi:mannosyltransferase OCH1-like enzyme
MIPKIIHQCMLSNFNEPPKMLTAEERRLCRRMRHVMPDWEYRFWTDATVDTMVQEVFPEHLKVFRTIQRGVVKADIARYMYLFAFGGFYFDIDYKMLRAIDEDTLFQRCVLPIARSYEHSFALGNAVMGSEPRHAFWADFITHIFSTKGLAEVQESKVGYVTGPSGLTDFYLSRRYLYDDVYLPRRPIFHPVHILGGFLSQTEPKTVGIHLCWGSWRTKNPLGAIRRLIHRKVTSF